MTPRSVALHAAVRNNADWCVTVCHSHGITGTFGEAAWWSPRRTPPYHPDAVTLRPDATAADLLPGIDTSGPGCSVKDSFAALGLAPAGFTELFTARWIHRPAQPPAPAPPALRAEHVRTAARLREWQDAWHGGDPPDVFRPTLLNAPDVLVLTLGDGGPPRGGVVLNRAAGAVGLSNLFAVDRGDTAAVWSAALAAAADRFPGLPVVGYERGDGLDAAVDSGFTPVGELRVWLLTGTGRPAPT